MSELPQADFLPTLQQRCELHDATKVLLVALQDALWGWSTDQQRHDGEAASDLYGEMHF